AANLFLVVSLVRSALLVRSTRRPVGHWTRRPAARGRAGRGRPLAKKKPPSRITVEQWFHTSLGGLWLGSGVLFVVLMAVSGRWVRLVPTSWDVLPNAASVALQYLSWHWPHDDTWVAYNALQMLAYGGVVLLLAPLAALTGLRQSALWPNDAAVNRWFSLERSRAVHRVVQTLFFVFVAVHLNLVLGTGALRNLNHMFGARDDTSVLGPHLMVVVLGLAVAAWFAARPVLLRALAGLFGKVTR
ncbi:MAG: cytochrome b/b6 domain-containing protein, partial [Cellulomonas sp.]|nr:cytochrome b/b6 domain-containing protein [Cellulomonas sp.]